MALFSSTVWYCSVTHYMIARSLSKMHRLVKLNNGSVDGNNAIPADAMLRITLLYSWKEEISLYNMLISKLLVHSIQYVFGKGMPKWS